MTIHRGSTCIAVVLPMAIWLLETHQFIWLYQIPEPEPELGQLMIPNLSSPSI